MNFKTIRGQPCRIIWSHRDPSLRRTNVGNIFVKNLSQNIDTTTLYDTFSMVGKILSCKVAKNSRGDPLGYGFVHYESEESAFNAIERVDGKMIDGNVVSVAAFKSKKERGGSTDVKFTNVFVKNLPQTFKQEDLDKLFSKCGTITSSMLPLSDKEEDKKNNLIKGFAFINFQTAEQAANAVETFNDYVFPSTTDDEKQIKLYVGRAQKREEREKELREKFEQLRAERQQKYAGVNLYVKNLSDDTSDDKLRTEFAKFGSITSARVMCDQAGKSKGFGFVCFATPEEATKAVTEMNGHMLGNKPLYVALAQRKEVRRAQLEQQHAARAKMGAPQGAPMYGPPQGPPMFFPQGAFPGMPHQRMMYQQPLVQGGRRGWTNHPPNQMMRGQYQYNLMPLNGQQRGGVPARGRGRGGGQQRTPQGPQANMNQRRQGNVKYAENVRNRNQAPQQQAPPSPQEEAVSLSAVDEPLNAKALAVATPEDQKQMIGERLFPLIEAQQGNLAGKITGMLLEMDNSELLHLLESPAALNEKIAEALHVLKNHDSK
jgi:polyadenylate-binding protein